MKEPAVWIWTSANRSWRSTLEPLGLFHFSSVYLFRSKGSFFFVGWLQNILTGLTKSEGPRLNLRIHPTTRPTRIYRLWLQISEGIMQCSSYNCWFTNRELFICIISKRKKMPKHCINWWLLTLFLVEYIYMYAWSRWKAYSLWSCTLNFCNYIYLSPIFWEDLPATYYEFSVTIYIYRPFSGKTFLHPIMSYIPASFMYLFCF